MTTEAPKPEAPELTTGRILKSCPAVTGFSRDKAGRLAVALAGRSDRFAGDGTTAVAVDKSGAVVYTRGKGTLSPEYLASIEAILALVAERGLSLVKK